MLGMPLVIIANVDRISINETCLKHGITLELLLGELKKVTQNIRIHSEPNQMLEVFFNANDVENYPKGYENNVMAVIKEYTDRIVISSKQLTLKADFEAPLR